MSGEYSYIGRAWCGCVVAARVDRGDSRTASAVAEMIREGLTVERVLTKDVEGMLNWDCKHESRPPQSNFESVESRIDQQLRQLQMGADARRFREVLKLLVAEHNICVVQLPRGWGVNAKDGAIQEQFVTFADAWRFVLEMMEVKG